MWPLEWSKLYMLVWAEQWWGLILANPNCERKVFCRRCSRWPKYHICRSRKLLWPLRTLAPSATKKTAVSVSFSLNLEDECNSTTNFFDRQMATQRAVNIWIWLALVICACTRPVRSVPACVSGYRTNTGYRTNSHCVSFLFLLLHQL